MGWVDFIDPSNYGSKVANGKRYRNSLPKPLTSLVTLDLPAGGGQSSFLFGRKAFANLQFIKAVSWAKASKMPKMDSFVEFGPSTHTHYLILEFSFILKIIEPNYSIFLTFF